MTIHWMRTKRYGAVIIAAALVCLFASMLAVSWHYKSWYKMWDFFDVDHPKYIWGDLYVILYPLRCFEMGNLDFGDRACHDKYAVFNYPLLWLQISSLLGISVYQADIIALGMIGVLCATFLFLFRRANILEGIVASIAVLSPPVLFAMQRANCEEIIFAMLVAVCLIPDAKIFIVRPLIIFFAAVLKLYPALAFPLFFINTRSHRERILLLLCAAGFIVYCLLKTNEIAFIQKITLHGLYPAFGVNVLPERLPLSKSLHAFMMDNRTAVKAVLLPLAALLTYAICRRYQRWYKPLVASLGQDAYSRCFYMGASIFVFMFFAQGHNWAYRLLFLIMCMPISMQWAVHYRLRLRIHGILLTANILITLWLCTLLPTLADIFSWVVCIHLATILLPKAQEILSSGTMPSLKPTRDDP